MLLTGSMKSAVPLNEPAEQAGVASAHFSVRIWRVLLSRGPLLLPLTAPEGMKVVSARECGLMALPRG
jgi:hypothetical protein